jgi:Cof subfamily protein (haloacid dehalogenase superfamily)
LFAIDLDGTLLRSDQTIAATDRAAVEELRRSGADVVVATGRFPAGARSIACELRCNEALICADGAIVLERNVDHAVGALGRSYVARLVAYFRAKSLGFFALGSECVHFASHDEAYLAYVEGWTRGAARHRDSPIEGDVVCVLALGQEHEVASARDEIAELGVCLDIMPLTRAVWALRVRQSGIDKGSALAALCHRRGFSRSAIVALGNDWNDLPLFAAAGTSFAMRDAPLEVRAQADYVLEAASDRGGGLAEVLARLSRAA